ncbi:peptide-methionine (R)-S-oxide reductase MsrB [Pseudomonas aeruginosa]|nr:peptide-methionine (R)-S-oxide reductase MsrB [Pseudomonas aeruginosa]
MSKIDKPLDSWREELTEEQFHICRLGGTERAFSGEYHATKTPGSIIAPAAARRCSTPTPSTTSGSGWPSYFQPVDAEAVRELDDFSHGMHRIEVRCGRCDAHLGHVFPDGPRPTGLRYYINSASLKLVPRES